MNSDLLDEYCRLEFGHTDWEVTYENGNAHITMYAEPRPDYSENLDIDLDGGLSATKEQENEND